MKLYSILSYPIGYIWLYIYISFIYCFGHIHWLYIYIHTGYIYIQWLYIYIQWLCIYIYIQWFYIIYIIIYYWQYIGYMTSTVYPIIPRPLSAYCQSEIQEPNMEVLYHRKPYFECISLYIP